MNRVSMGSYSSKKGWQKSEPQLIFIDNPKTKKKKEKKKRSRLNTKKIAVLALLILLPVCGVLFYNFVNRIPGINIPVVQPARSLCNDILDPQCWTDSFKPQLKQTNGTTNILIVGLDTRSNDKGLLNTDTVVLISFNHETQESMIISIPRDFYSAKYVTRINAIYAFTKDRDPSDPFRYLKDEVSSITGKDIHYFTTVKFDSFMDVIDEFNGIEVCPEEAFTAQYPNDYPKAGESQWLFYEFEQGCQSVDGEKALVYSRFRYVSKGPSSLASDFSRARRQQEVLEALKDKLFEQDIAISERASIYWKLLQNYKANITTDIGFEDILAGLGYLDTASKDPINVVLDPNFGGINQIIYTDSSSGAYYIKPKSKNYDQIHSQLDKILENSGVYKEKPKVLVRNWGKTYLPNAHVVKELEKTLSFTEMYVYKNEFGKADFVGIKIVDFTNGKKPETLELIKSGLGVDEVSLSSELGIEQSTNDEDFAIIVGLPINSTVTPTPKI